MAAYASAKFLMRQLVMASSLLVLLSGCQSIRETFDTEAHKLEIAGRFKNKIYVGIRSDFRVMADPFYLSHIFTSLIDLPFSLILDTVLLPYTIPVTIKNLSERNVIDPVCFLLEGIRNKLLLLSDGKRAPDVFEESKPCRTASPWGEDRWAAQRATIPVAQLESVASFYDKIMPFVNIKRIVSRDSFIRYHENDVLDSWGEIYISLILEPAERRIYEPFVLWATNEGKANEMKVLIPKVGGTIVREEYSLSEYWPNLKAFDFTDLVDTKFQVLYRPKGPSPGWVDTTEEK